MSAATAASESAPTGTATIARAIAPEPSATSPSQIWYAGYAATIQTIRSGRNRTATASAAKKTIAVAGGSEATDSSSAPAATAAKIQTGARVTVAKNIAAPRRTGTERPQTDGSTLSSAPPKTSARRMKTNWTTLPFTADEDVLQRRKVDGRKHLTLAPWRITVLTDLKQSADRDPLGEDPSET